MRWVHIVVPVALFAAVVSTAIAATVDEGNTQGWIQIRNRAFAFSLPPSMVKTDLHGMDSFVEEYVAEGLRISFDFGAYANDFSGWPKDTKYEELKIDGKPARIATRPHVIHEKYSFFTQVHIPEAPGSLSMFASCRGEKELAIARQIFLSITFQKPNHPSETTRGK